MMRGGFKERIRPYPTPIQAPTTSAASMPVWYGYGFPPGVKATRCSLRSKFSVIARRVGVIATQAGAEVLDCFALLATTGVCLDPA